ncbi:MAG TPA: ATP-dependent DNA ligase [Acidimicrobiales bacterium]|nr:ATP-dependent DNA ligase [Acidimicrobiales bacterium]
MQLPVMPPVKPMLAKLARELPEPDGMLYEPKWDGFRCIVFRDGDEVELGSRNEKPLTRYFPELPPALKASVPERCVLDGEVVIGGDNGLDFEALLQRIHPAASRIKMLAETTPAAFVAFDLLALGDVDFRPRPFAERRAALEEALAGARPPVHLTPSTADRATAAEWFDRFEGAGLDGVVAKPVSLPYREDERVMWKVKHARTADCVVAGFRWHKDGAGVGSLLLGLYDDQGTLHHVGVASSFTVARRKELTGELAPYREAALEGHPWAGWAEAAAEFAAAGGGRMPGGQSRWNAGRSMEWEPLRPELVAEVSFDHLQGDRFRHATHFERWRPDRDARTCTYGQLDVAVPEELSAVFRA